MTIAIVTQTTYSGTTATGSTAVTIPAPANGNVVVNCMALSSTTVHISSDAETNVTFPASADIYSHTNADAEIWHGVAAASAGTTLTNTYSANLPATARGNISEWSGLDTTTPLQTASGNSGNDTHPTTATVTPTAGLACVLIAMCRSVGAFTSLDTAGWTALSTPSTGTQYAYQVVASPSGSYNCVWTFGTGLWESAIAVYQATAAGGRLFRQGGLDGHSVFGGKQFNPPLS